MALSGAEYSMVVMAAFSLSLVVILSSGPFSINIDILGFPQNCFYTVLTLSFRRASGMPMIESSSAMSQDYLDFYYTSSTRALGPNVKMGQGHKLLGPTLFNKHFCLFIYLFIYFTFNVKINNSSLPGFIHMKFN